MWESPRFRLVQLHTVYPYSNTLQFTTIFPHLSILSCVERRRKLLKQQPQAALLEPRLGTSLPIRSCSSLACRTRRPPTPRCSRCSSASSLPSRRCARFWAVHVHPFANEYTQFVCPNADRHTNVRGSERRCVWSPGDPTSRSSSSRARRSRRWRATRSRASASRPLTRFMSRSPRNNTRDPNVLYL